MFRQSYEKLERSLTDVVAEEQAKLGYRKEAIRLYYPLSTLNHFFNSNDSIITFFRRWDEKCIVKNIPDGEFDLLVMFIDYEDPYYYCFKDEGFHIIYHRFLPEDYKDLYDSPEVKSN